MHLGFTLSRPVRCETTGVVGDEIVAAGIEVDWISGGGTPTARATHETGVVTEVRAGTFPAEEHTYR